MGSAKLRFGRRKTSKIIGLEKHWMVQDGAFSHDGKTLATTDIGLRTAIRDPKTGKELRNRCGCCPGPLWRYAYRFHGGR